MKSARYCVATLLDPHSTLEEKAIVLGHFLDDAEVQAVSFRTESATVQAAAIRRLYETLPNDFTDAVLRLGPVLDAAIRYSRVTRSFTDGGIGDCCILSQQ